MDIKELQNKREEYAEKASKMYLTIANLYEHIMRCPFCDFEYIHFIKVEINAGGEITTIDSKGTHLTSGEPAGRGTQIEINYECENGHKWTHRSHFHKGQITCTVRDYDLGLNLSDNLWRT